MVLAQPGPVKASLAACHHINIFHKLTNFQPPHPFKAAKTGFSPFHPQKQKPNSLPSGSLSRLRFLGTGLRTSCGTDKLTNPRELVASLHPMAGLVGCLLFRMEKERKTPDLQKYESLN